MTIPPPHLVLRAGMDLGLLARALTQFAAIGAAEGAVASGAAPIPEEMTAEQLSANAAVGYSLTYVFGSVDMILLVRLPPGLFGVAAAAAASALWRDEDGDWNAGGEYRLFDFPRRCAEPARGVYAQHDEFRATFFTVLYQLRDLPSDRRADRTIDIGYEDQRFAAGRFDLTKREFQRRGKHQKNDGSTSCCSPGPRQGNPCHLLTIDQRGGA